jgi:hypothetical protein
MIASFITMVSCAEATREKVQQIVSSGGEYGYYIYRRGAYSTNFMTIERSSGAESLVSISYCDAVAARFAGNKVDVAGFNARMSLGRLDLSSPSQRTEIRLVAYGRPPTAGELQSLAKQDFTIVNCDDL